MQKVQFIGLQKRKSSTGNDYYMMFCGSPIDEKSGLGLYPMDFRVTLDEYKDFIDNCAEGVEFDINYEFAYDKQGHGKRILKSYKF